MSQRPWCPLRDGAQQVSVYNEGHIVYLWDEAHRSEIESSGADFESGYAETDGQIDAVLKQLAKRDLMIAYELYQDDPILVEVMVGAPLSKQELSTARWSKPLLARLNLPSGKLRIDTANTLPMSGSSGEEEAGVVLVPDGEYVVHLYRLDWDRLTADGLLNDGDSWNGPQELLVLTPASDVKPLKNNKPLLRYTTPPSWHGKYKIVDGTLFIGQAQSRSQRGAYQVNLDPAALEALGIEVGSLIRLELDGLIMEAVYVGDREPLQVQRHQTYHLAGGRLEFGYAYRLIWDSDTERVLTIDRSVTATDFPVLNRRVPVKVTVLSERLVVPGLRKV